MAQHELTTTDYRHDAVMADDSEIGDDATISPNGTPAAPENDVMEDSANAASALSTTVEPTDYSVFSNPPNLGRIRESFFELADPIEMSREDFEKYWPFVDNLWRSCGSNELPEVTNSPGDFYMCKRNKKNTHAYNPKPTAEGKISRKRRPREEGFCPMAMKVNKTGASGRYTIHRVVGPEVRHTHDLDTLDSLKRNSGIMDTARREGVRGFAPASIYWKMMEEPDKMEEAGGKHLKVSDVRNVQAAWRTANPTAELKAHTGYGNGSIRRRSKLTILSESSPADSEASKQMSKRPPGTGQFRASQTQPTQITHRQPQTQGQDLPQAPPQQSQSQPQEQSRARLDQQPSRPTPQQGLGQQVPPPYQQAQRSLSTPQHSVSQTTPGVASPAPLSSTVSQGVAHESSVREALQYPEHARGFLQEYLPSSHIRPGRPHVTLTWATSLDARISLMPNTQTAISGPETKAMTHYLRSRHDVILIGAGTAIADNPSLNCRLVGSGGYGGPDTFQQPRPVIIDPHARLQIHPDMKVLRIAAEGRAKAPWIVVSPTAKIDPMAVRLLTSCGGGYLMMHELDPKTGKLSWQAIFNALYNEGVKSVMIEGGGTVLSELLEPRFNDWISSIILTIAPTFFGRAGTSVSPEPSVDKWTNTPVANRLKDVRWQPMGDADVVMCGHLETGLRESVTIKPVGLGSHTSLNSPTLVGNGMRPDSPAMRNGTRTPTSAGGQPHLDTLPRHQSKPEPNHHFSHHRQRDIDNPKEKPSRPPGRPNSSVQQP